MAEMHPGASKEHQFGPHRVTVEAPDLLYLHTEGAIEVAHMKAFMELVGELPAEVHVIRDGRDGGTATPAAREYLLKTIPKGKSKIASFISFGAPFHTRTVAVLITKAIRLLRHDAPILGFTNTEAEARAWIDKIRADLRRE